MSNPGNSLKACVAFLVCAAAITPLQSQPRATVASATKFVTLYRLGTNPNDGSYSHAGLVQGTNGILYGTTFVGGNYPEGGTTFTITTGGKFATMVSFDGTNGFEPLGNL